MKGEKFELKILTPKDLNELGSFFSPSFSHRENYATMVASFKRVEYHGQFFDVRWNRIYKNSCHLEYFLKETAGRIMTLRRCWHHQLSLSFEFQNSNEQTLWGQSITPERPRVLNTQNLARNILVNAKCNCGGLVWVFGLSMQGLYTKHSHLYLAPRWLKEQLMMFIFQCPFAGILSLSENGSKLWKAIGEWTKFQTLLLGCVSAMSWSQTLGLNIPQLWILSRSKFCIELQVKQYWCLIHQPANM